MCAGRDVLGDFGKMQVHSEGVALGQNQRRALALPGGDRAENIGRGGPLIFGRRGARAAFGPAPRDLVLLADAGFVSEPDFYLVDVDTLFPRDVL